MVNEMRLATILLPAVLIPLTLAAAKEGNVTVRYMHILSEIQSRFATTDIISELENTGSTETEVVYVAELPENAFIRTFYLERDGQVTHGTIKGREEAAEEYETAKTKKKNAALVRKTNDREFELKVALAPFSKIGFNLTYQEVLQKHQGMFKHVVNIRSNFPIVNLEVNVLVADKHNFSTIHVPQFEEELGELPVEALMQKQKDERIIMQASSDESGSIAYISFDPREKIQNGELVLLYNTTEPEGATELQVVDGYFLHQYSPPEDLEAGNKTVIFVLDKSGSMKGTKLEQLKDAMHEILDEISETDRLNIITFDKNIEHWRDEVTTLDAESKIDAKKFIDKMEANGGTNIGQALETALQMLAAAEKGRSSFMPSVLILSDGKATVGLKEHADILDTISQLGYNYSVNSISFGNDADYLLMKKLGGRQQPTGLARRIFENADATIQIAGFYHEIAYPLLKHIKVTYLDEAVDVSSVISSGEQDFLFSGEDFFQLGRFSDVPEKGSSVNALVETEGVNGNENKLTEVKASSACIDPALFDEIKEASPKTLLLCGRDDPSIGNFVERMWAHLSVRKYERLFDSTTQSVEEKQNVAAMIKRLSLKYGFVSSQTSMVVVLGDDGNELPLEEREFEEQELAADMDSPPHTSAFSILGVVVVLSLIVSVFLYYQGHCKLIRDEKIMNESNKADVVKVSSDRAYLMERQGLKRLAQLQTLEEEQQPLPTDDAPGIHQKLGSELAPRFKTPFVSSHLHYPEYCSIHVILLVDRVFKRRISSLRTARLVSDLSLSLPDNATLSIGDIAANRSIIILGGNEDKLFSMVEANKGFRQHLMIISEFSASLERPFEYLRALAPAFHGMTVAKTSGSLTTNERSLVATLGKVTVVKNPDSVALADTVHC